MTDSMFPTMTPELAHMRRELAPEMRAGGAYAHSAISLDELSDHTHDN